MIFQDIEFHNVAELTTTPENHGWRLQRVPESLRPALNEGAQMRVLQPDNCEIRYTADGPSRITLSSEGQTRVTVFCGLFDNRQRFLIGPQPQTIEIIPTETLAQLDSTYCNNMAFSPQVVRLIFGGPQRDPIIFHGIDGENVRPPLAEDLPELRYLAYGTSITHGFDAEGPHLSYVSQAARHLGADLINLGVGGSAHCEPEFADYMAGRDDWQIATLALSVNMRDFPIDEFYSRVSYMVNKVAGSDPNRVVACITLYPFFLDFGIVQKDKPFKAPPEEYRQALRDAVAACPHHNVHLIEGPNLLTDIGGLTTDLLHPGDNGMIEMGRNLAERLKPLVRQST